MIGDTMKRLFFVIILMLISGCVASNDNQPSTIHNEENEQIISDVDPPNSEPPQGQEAEYIKLTFQPHHSDQDIREVHQLKAANIIKEQEVLDGKIIIYDKQDDPQNVYGAYRTEDKLFDLGIIGGKHEGRDDHLVSIDQINIFDRSIISINGVFGANAPVKNYFSAEEDEIYPFLQIATGNATETDLDGDGTVEIISSHGAHIQTYIYIWEDEDFYVANVNEALDATSVYVNEEKQIIAFYDTNSPNKVYTYDSGILILVD